MLHADWMGLLLLAFMLGLRHGMDPDHLATIDGIARANSSTRPRLARWSGLLFSLGHGMTVILATAVISLLASTGHIPEWFDALGAWISIFFLFTLGLSNLYLVLRTPSGDLVKMCGVKSRLFNFLFIRTQRPGWVILVGALFALSFDTMSQVAFFSISAPQPHGWLAPFLLGLVFMFGMLLTDGLNGYWVARMMLRTDRLALISSRVLGLAVAGLSLIVGCLAVIQQLFPDKGIHTFLSPLQQGATVVVVILLSFVLATRMSRTKPRFSV